MMKIYVVTMDKLTCDGHYDNTVTLGYYMNKATAEKAAKEHKAGYANRAAEVKEIEVNEE